MTLTNYCKSGHRKCEGRLPKNDMMVLEISEDKPSTADGRE
jgi:hypothetical protein